MNSAPLTKVCTGCKQELELGCFNKNQKGKYGVRSKCKLCVSKNEKAWREANLEKVRAKNKAYREANLEKVRAKNKAYHEANPGKVRARYKAYREANPEKVRAKNKAWREANPEKIRAIAKAYISSLPPPVIINNLIRGTPLKPQDIPESLVELKRIQIFIHRELKRSHHENHQ